MQERWKVAQRVIRDRDINRICPIYDNNAPPYAYILDSVGAATVSKGGVTMAIGLLLLGKAHSAGLDPALFAPHLTKLMNEGTTLLGEDMTSWHFEGSVNEIQEMQSWLNEGPTRAKRRRVQALFGLEERRSGRFLVLNQGGSALVTNDQRQISCLATDAFYRVVDVQFVTRAIRNEISGHFFSLKRSA